MYHRSVWYPMGFKYNEISVGTVLVGPRGTKFMAMMMALWGGIEGGWMIMTAILTWLRARSLVGAVGAEDSDGGFMTTRLWWPTLGSFWYEAKAFVATWTGTGMGGSHHRRRRPQWRRPNLRRPRLTNFLLVMIPDHPIHWTFFWTLTMIVRVNIVCCCYRRQRRRRGGEAV